VSNRRRRLQGLPPGICHHSGFCGEAKDSSWFWCSGLCIAWVRGSGCDKGVKAVRRAAGGGVAVGLLGAFHVKRIARPFHVERKLLAPSRLGVLCTPHRKRYNARRSMHKEVPP